MGHEAVEGGLVAHQVRIDAGDASDDGRDGHAWLDEALEPIFDHAVADADGRDLDDTVKERAAAGRLEVDDDEGQVLQRERCAGHSGQTNVKRTYVREQRVGRGL